MGFFANTQETAERFGKYITEYQELFRTNDVGFGSPEEFFRLAPRMARDESFREGFTALTRSVQRQEEGRLSLTEMLTVVAIASGGDGIETVGDAGTVPVSLLAVFLAGIGGWSGGEQEEAAVKDATGALNGKDGEVGGQAGDDQAAAELQQRLIAGPEEDIGKLTTTLFGGPAQVKEALGRLEMNTLQMKMHLDSIDSRMERIEPHLDELKSRTSASSERAQQEEPLTVPTPPIKPWPKPEEEAPKPEWMASAPPMKPWPEEKEQDLAWAGSVVETSPPVRTNRKVKETEPVWREPLREPLRDSGRRAEIPSRGRTLADGAASLRATNSETANAEMERDYDEDLPIRVPFDEYLYMEEESGWGRRLAGAFAVVVIVLVISGAMFYRSHGWHGYNDAVHTVGAAVANKKAAVAEWFTSQRTQTATAISSTAASAAPSSASSSSQPSQEAATGTAPPTSGGIAEREAPDALPAAQTAPVETASSAQPASGAAAHATQSQAASAQTSASTPGAAQAKGATANDDQVAAGSIEPRQARPARPGMRGVVAVMAGSGAAPEDMSATNLKHGYHSTVPVFVDVARLSAVSDPRPEYPRSALASGITGEVVVQANITRNGDVESAQIVSGPAGLLKPSLDAVRQWRFRPYRVKGEPVEARTYVRFRYAPER